MPAPFKTTPLPEQLAATAARIASSGATVRRLADRWCIVFPGAGRRAAEQLDDSMMAALLAHGHLVPGRAGGFQTLKQVMAKSGRLGDHRPERPIEAPEGAAAPVVNDAESPLSWLRSRRDRAGQALVSDAQYLAGERLRADYERGCMGARTTASWDPSATAGRSAGNSVGHVTDRALAARQALYAALDAVGPELSGILVQICCLSAGLEQAERLLEMPQRSGKAVLGLALTRLARHYGLLAAPRGAAARGVSHWGLADYRPDLTPQAGS